MVPRIGGAMLPSLSAVWSISGYFFLNLMVSRYDLLENSSRIKHAPPGEFATNDARFGPTVLLGLDG
jgi:hypothetical protein